MNLEEQIKDQYNQRKNTESLYSGGYYVENVQREIKENIKTYLNKEFSEKQNITVLEIGAGQGNNADVFLSNGLSINNIYFNELLPERINAIKTKYPNNTIFEGNIIEILINQKFDIIYQSTVFTSILQQNDREKLAQKMLDLLNPNGIILWYDFIYNNPKNSNVRKVDLNELKHLFSATKNIYYKKITLAPPVGRRVGRLYKIFNIPLLRSHILAVIKK